ncbi:hypothetical protein [Streptomyces palmae]|uniref:Uncharacterized protein n=1 Tax=Streptomyces palmae TaxID=1701085 RepID=A0A4Z0GA11_9ACTN|nr:hypothetical protein [Streptomyces palmae]TGA93160.1 hypothetical protein E4099_26885 [Streptomyces palmae]
MSTGEPRGERAVPAELAVVSVLAPTLAGVAAVIFLLVGSALRMLDAAHSLGGTMVMAGTVFAVLTPAMCVVAVVVLRATARRRSARADEAEPGAPARTGRARGRAAQRTLDLASLVAGSRRAHLRDEWAAILAGDPENGVTLSPRRRMGYALGFLLAALRMRLRDLTAPLWLPVDWLLSVESRTHALITAVVGAQALYIRHQDGLHALVTDGWSWCGACAVALRLFTGWLRRLRGIELASTRGDSGER